MIQTKLFILLSSGALGSEKSYICAVTPDIAIKS